jgi:ribosomal protein S1
MKKERCEAMSFFSILKKSNSCLTHLRGSVLQCSVEQIQDNMVVVETGLKTRFICLKHELEEKRKIGDEFNFGVENVEVFGEPKILLPKQIKRICKKKLVWTELTQIWRSDNNRVKGFFLNSVNGGYAVAIAGHIAFLPKSLRKSRKVFHSQLRMFSILKMNPKILNIVVKEIGEQSRKKTTKKYKKKCLN